MKSINRLLLSTLFVALLMVAPVAHGQESAEEVLQEEAPKAITYESPLLEITALSSTIIGRMLEGDIASIPADIDRITTFVQESDMEGQQKQDTLVSLERMSFFFSPENGGSVTPVTFLLASNDVYKSLNDYLYAKEEQVVPAYMYQLTYLARKLQFQTLEGNWDEIEENTAEDIIDLVSDIYRNLEDPTVWQKKIRPIKDIFGRGVEKKDTTLVYGAGQAYLSAAPLIETTTMKKIEKEEKVEAQQKKKNNIILIVIIGALAVVGGLFFIRRKVS